MIDYGYIMGILGRFEGVSIQRRYIDETVGPSGFAFEAAPKRVQADRCGYFLRGSGDCRVPGDTKETHRFHAESVPGAREPPALLSSRPLRYGRRLMNEVIKKLIEGVNPPVRGKPRRGAVFGQVKDDADNG